MHSFLNEFREQTWMDRCPKMDWSRLSPDEHLEDSLPRVQEALRLKERVIIKYLCVAFRQSSMGLFKPFRPGQ
ncbi:hypothetical protein CEXT_686991 [Caerostris extrusa]|uniref:Uncharacterized protein n=1 Tax=Caerostris extrusa TaxID=172846 RepID=A0AAV4X4P8_CAEEX|nr:hypothetical protein CEXT_686991 [Caerostris extrusa]